MDDLSICKAVRLRVVNATGIDPLISLKVMGEQFDNVNLPFWVEEYLVGGTPATFTNRRARVSSYLIQYDFNVPAGNSMEEIERRMQTAEAELKEASKFDYIIKSGTRDEDYAALLRIYELRRGVRLA